jgi:hypothetical protein
MSPAPTPHRAAASGGWLRRELGATLALSWPLVLANLAVNVMPAINAMMLGSLSPHALAAGSLGFYLLQPPFVLGVGVVAALSPIAAAKIGAGADPAGIRRAKGRSCLWRARSHRHRTRRLVGLRRHGRLRPPFGDHDDRRAAAPDRAFHRPRSAGKRRDRRHRHRAAQGRGDLPDLRREPGDARQHAARPARAAIFQIFDASQATLANMLRGLHDSRVPLVIALIGYWAIGAPVGVALGFATPLGAVGVWIGLAIVAVLLMARWLGTARRGFPAPS